MGYETGIPFLKITAQLVDCDKKDLGITPSYNRSEAGLAEQETAEKSETTSPTKEKPVTISWPLLLNATNLNIPIFRLDPTLRQTQGDKKSPTNH